MNCKNCNKNSMANVKMPLPLNAAGYAPFKSMWAGKAYYGNNINNYEDLQYFYHSDHLGSTNYVTDVNSDVYQHIEYLPWGEVMLEERKGNNHTNYLFNAKELDEESGFYYYSARYADPKYITGFISRDPMEDKYPWISTYAYCFNNPIVLVDPDGRRPRLFEIMRRKGEAVFGCSKADANFQAGNYHITPVFDASNNIIAYNAGQFLENGDYRTDYQMQPGDLEGFIDNINMYQGYANYIYQSGEMNPYAMMGDAMMEGSFKGVGDMMAQVWGNALKDPGFYLSMAASIAGIGSNIASKTTGIASNAAKGTGNFGLGSATKAEAYAAGAKWVGKGYRVSSNGQAWISADATRQFRPPTVKKGSGLHQANFQSRRGTKGEWTNNGHLDITD